MAHQTSVQEGDPLPAHDLSKELEIESSPEGSLHNGEYTEKRAGEGHTPDSGSEKDRYDTTPDVELGRGNDMKDRKEKDTEETWLLDRKEEVEITPVEAFGVDVSGEQSPCKWFSI